MIFVHKHVNKLLIIVCLLFSCALFSSGDQAVYDAHYRAKHSLREELASMMCCGPVIGTMIICTGFLIYESTGSYPYFLVPLGAIYCSCACCLFAKPCFESCKARRLRELSTTLPEPIALTLSGSEQSLEPRLPLTLSIDNNYRIMEHSGD